MIELERGTTPDFEGEDTQVWADADFSHVIVEETAETVPHRLPGPGWYVRDENGERGPCDTFEQAIAAAQKAWGEVTLAPANRLRAAVEVEDENDVGTYLLEYLATYGTAGIDVQELASQVFARIEEG